MFAINYWAILISAVLSMILGFLWYGPLFGQHWMKIVGADWMDREARKKMQRGAARLYVVQFLLTIFQVTILSRFVADAGFTEAIWIWAGFVMPTIAGSAMWNNDSAKISWARFLIQGGYQLVIFIMFGCILGMWF